MLYINVWKKGIDSVVDLNNSLYFRHGSPFPLLSFVLLLVPFLFLELTQSFELVRQALSHWAKFPTLVLLLKVHVCDFWEKRWVMSNGVSLSLCIYRGLHPVSLTKVKLCDFQVPYITCIVYTLYLLITLYIFSCCLLTSFLIYTLNQLHIRTIVFKLSNRNNYFYKIYTTLR